MLDTGGNRTAPFQNEDWQRSSQQSGKPTELVLLGPLLESDGSPVATVESERTLLMLSLGALDAGELRVFRPPELAEERR